MKITSDHNALGLDHNALGLFVRLKVSKGKIGIV
jgi:hypothetical protein